MLKAEIFKLDRVYLDLTPGQLMENKYIWTKF